MREIRSRAELHALRPGSALLTSDTSDTVVLRSGGRYASGFINADGGELTPDVLWEFGTKPFTVLWEPTP
jgi:hypothetical protein